MVHRSIFTQFIIVELDNALVSQLQRGNVRAVKVIQVSLSNDSTFHWSELDPPKKALADLDFSIELVERDSRWRFIAPHTPEADQQ